LTNVIVAGPRERWYLITEGKILIKNETKVAEWVVFNEIFWQAAVW